MESIVRRAIVEVVTKMSHPVPWGEFHRRLRVTGTTTGASALIERERESEPTAEYVNRFARALADEVEGKITELAIREREK